MLINNKSTIMDLLQATAGTWDLSKDSTSDWKVLEMGKLRIFKKQLVAGTNLLPDKLRGNRLEVYPVLLFHKDFVTGKMLNLQENTIEVEDNCLCVILQF